MNEHNKQAAGKDPEATLESSSPAVETPESAAGMTQPVIESARRRTYSERGARTPRKSKSKPQAESLEELLKFAYESKARLLDFPKDSLRKIPVTDEGVVAAGAVISTRAPSDPTLAMPFKLLQYVARQGVDLKRSDDGALACVLNRLVDLSIAAMSHNPVFRDWADQLRDARKQPQLSPQLVRDEAGKVDADELGLAIDQFKRADRDHLVKNAVACYGLLRILQRDWTLDRYIDEQYDSAWRYEVPDAASSARVCGTIGASRDLNVLGIVAGNYIARIARLDHQIAYLEGELSAATNREMRLNEEVRSAKDSEQSAMARAEALSADIVRLHKELAAERGNRVVDKSHMADDYEALRTRIIRRLSGEIDLLTDGLHALRNGAPTVADEFLDRSLLALTREVERLKDAAGGQG